MVGIQYLWFVISRFPCQLSVIIFTSYFIAGYLIFETPGLYSTIVQSENVYLILNLELIFMYVL